MKIGLSTILFCIFLTLKLCNVIDWSWWWVTAPLWISFILAFLLGVCREYRKQTERENIRANSGLMRRLKEAQRKREELLKERNSK